MESPVAPYAAGGICLEGMKETGAVGRVAGIEILDARKRFGETDPLRSVTLEGVALSGN